MMWWGPGDGWGGWIVMTLTMVGFWALVIGLVVWLVRGPREQGTKPTRQHDAVAILEERFARGEIDREEFEARKAVLLGR